MRMFCLSAADAATDTIWRDMQPHFERFAEATGEIAPHQIRRAAAAELMQIWGLQDAERVHAVAVTELSETPRGLICTVRVSSSDGVAKPMQERLVDAIGAWARENNCVAVRIVGRRGWLRRFPRFHQQAVVMEWDLCRTH